MKYFATIDGQAGGRTHELAVEEVAGTHRGQAFKVRFGADGPEVAVDYAAVGPNEVSLLVGGRSHAIAVSRAYGERGAFVVSSGHASFRVTVASERERLRSERTPLLGRRTSGAEAVRSVMPGIVTRVIVKPGDRIEAGSPLLHLEAMKMENEIRSAAAGVVAKVHVGPGQTVNTGDLLVELTPP